MIDGAAWTNNRTGGSQMNRTKIPYLTHSWSPTHGEWKLSEPLKVKKPARIGVSFMVDLFNEDVPFKFIDKVFAAMALAPWHTYLLLTKRPHRASRYTLREHSLWRGFHHFIGPSISTKLDVENWCWKSGVSWRERDRRMEVITDGGGFYFDNTDFTPNTWPLPNVHLGTSCSTQADLDANVPELLRCPAAVRWVSLPLVEEVDVRQWLACPLFTCQQCGEEVGDGEQTYLGKCPHCLRGALDPQGNAKGGLDGVVVGCESGLNRRPCSPEWIKSEIDQCDAAGVPVYVKQMEIDGKVSTDPSEWPEWAQRRELPSDNTNQR